MVPQDVTMIINFYLFMKCLFQVQPVKNAYEIGGKWESVREVGESISECDDGGGMSFFSRLAGMFYLDNSS